MWKAFSRFFLFSSPGSGRAGACRSLRTGAWRFSSDVQLAGVQDFLVLDDEAKGWKAELEAQRVAVGHGVPGDEDRRARSLEPAASLGPDPEALRVKSGLGLLVSPPGHEFIFSPRGLNNGHSGRSDGIGQLPLSGRIYGGQGIPA